MFSALLSLQVVLSFAIATPLLHRSQSVAFIPPVDGEGGSQLDDAGNGLGEPLNVIISGLSSPEVLTDYGVVSWARSIGYSPECLGQYLGAPQKANLGDGNGLVDQINELRQDYGNLDLGTCVETLIGGNHFRYWRQNGTMADSGALFLAVSQEEGHTVSPNGYNAGRDKLVASATAGPTYFGNVKYTTTSETVTGLLLVGTAGVNHGISLDGIVALLTIKIM